MKFGLKKIIRLFSLLAAVSLLAFWLVSISPVDPVQTYVGAEASLLTPDQRLQIEEYWGLHENKTTRFFKWGNALLHGDFGQSLIYRKPVIEVIGERFKASVILMGLAWALSGVFGFVLGIVAAMKKGKWADKLISTYCFILASTPAFWLGLVLLMFFAVYLGWFPIGLSMPAGKLIDEVTVWDRLQHLILPAFTLSLIGVANVALHTREKLIDVLNSEFIRYARAKGEKGIQLIWKHGIRNIALPAVSLQFASFGELFGGVILTEQVFSYPGLGQAVVKAGLGGDIPLLLGITLFSSIFIFAGNSFADLLYQWIDPRMKKEVRYES